MGQKQLIGQSWPLIIECWRMLLDELSVSDKSSKQMVTGLFVCQDNAFNMDAFLFVWRLVREGKIGYYPQPLLARLLDCCCCLIGSSRFFCSASGSCCRCERCLYGETTEEGGETGEQILADFFALFFTQLIFVWGTYVSSASWFLYIWGRFCIVFFHCSSSDSHSYPTQLLFWNLESCGTFSQLLF